ncbi:DUF2730 family protein [Maridesulfovibrio sp.]|uniref:DUF2730 family protein n=1 Tax=Maridesulfovibrio sp. TaxID=2795000 RepID=UPI002AA85927|nr:DUF2730 family protein [Maridesulfovibrio sp.]
MSDDIWGWLRFGMNCLSTIGGGVVLWGIWSLKKSFVSHKDCDNCRKEITQKTTDLGHRVTQNENALEHLPTKDSTHKLELQLAGMRGDLKVLTEKIGSVEAINQQVGRIEEYLLNNKRG